MPYTFCPPIRTARFTVTVAAALLALVAVPNAASAAACKDTPTSTIFAAYGDFAQYKLFPNGDFDFGAQGWNLDNAVVDSNYSLKHSDAPQLVANGIEKSLRLSTQSRAVSSPYCVSDLYPSFRLFAFKRGGGAGNLTIKLSAISLTGKKLVTKVASLSPSSFTKWAPTPIIPLATALPLAIGETAQVRLIFEYGFKADGTADPTVLGPWRIDEVHVDPYRR